MYITKSIRPQYGLDIGPRAATMAQSRSPVQLPNY